MILLDYGSHAARDTDPIRTHPHQLFFTVFIEISGVKAFGILRSELEDIAHFDAAVAL